MDTQSFLHHPCSCSPFCNHTLAAIPLHPCPCIHPFYSPHPLHPPPCIYPVVFTPLHPHHCTTPFHPPTWIQPLAFSSFYIDPLHPPLVFIHIHSQLFTPWIYPLVAGMWEVAIHFRVTFAGYTWHSLSGFMLAMPVEVVMICGNDRCAHYQCIMYVTYLFLDCSVRAER